MSVIYLNTAKRLRKPDNITDILLSRLPAKLLHFPKAEQSDFRLESEFVYKTSPLGLGSAIGACVSDAHVGRKPLRQIVGRTPVNEVLSSGWRVTYYIDTLECGHQVTTYSHELEKKRRGCSECLEALSVPLPERKAA